jgi:hypothetical protein
MRFEVETSWEMLGSPTLVDGKHLAFPEMPRTHGVYQILTSTHFYVGEAKYLPLRFSGYRNPGGSENTEFPKTNRRVKRWLVAALDEQATVRIELCREASVFWELGERSDLDLSRKHTRLVVENLVIEQNCRMGLKPINILK